MIPATEPRNQRENARMLVLQAQRGTFLDMTIAALPDLLLPGDVVVVNDAATLPASLFARSSSGAAVEIRLIRYLGGSDWTGALFGSGDWRIATELRDPPQKLAAGSRLEIA